jgi:hypothetical protein
VEQRQCSAGEGKGKSSTQPTTPFIAARGGGRRRARWQNLWIENGCGGCGLALGVRSGRRCSDSGVDRRPHMV